jgi:HEAT repeat protein
MVLSVLCASGQDTEPSYRGTTLTQWLALYQRTWISTLTVRVEGQPATTGEEERRQAAEHAEAEEAVRKIGTNALPFLLKWIGQGQNADKQDQASTAITGFSILGPQAKAAIPDLTQVMMETNKPFASIDAIRALGCLGPDALPLILTVVSNSQTFSFAYGQVALQSILTMGSRGTDIRPAVPVLIQRLRERGEMTELAMETLLELQVEPDVTIPAVAECLHDSDYRIRQRAAECLATARPQARSAVPALVKALNDPQIYVRIAATNALRAIAPEMLKH